MDAVTKGLARAVASPARAAGAWHRSVRPAALLALTTALLVPQPGVLAQGTAGSAFLSVEGIRELPDGSTLVVDRGKRALFVVDWNTRQAKPVGRTGDGPGEYRYPRQLIPVGADSTILTDTETGRWLLLYRARIVSALEAHEPLARTAGSILAGADVMGRVLVLHGSHFPKEEVIARGGGASGYADSLAVIVVDRQRLDVDTVAQVRGGYRGINRTSARVGNGVVHYSLVNPLAVGDQALLFPDGWTAIVYASPYSVTWRSASGATTRGRPLPHTRQSLDERMKRRIIDDAWPPSPATPSWRTTDFPGWPEVLPPFLKDALLALPDGKLVIRRTSFYGDSAVQYDIVDRQGILSTVLRLPGNERIVGFGPGSVYVVVTDADENEHLHRRPWP